MNHMWKGWTGWKLSLLWIKFQKPRQIWIVSLSHSIWRLTTLMSWKRVWQQRQSSRLRNFNICVFITIRSHVRIDRVSQPSCNFLMKMTGVTQLFLQEMVHLKDKVSNLRSLSLTLRIKNSIVNKILSPEASLERKTKSWTIEIASITYNPPWTSIPNWNKKLYASKLKGIFWRVSLSKRTKK